MNINTDNPIIKYSDKGKPFPYVKLFNETLESYILEFKNVRLDKLTPEDAARCLARIFKKMYVNGVPVLEFFKEDLDNWANLDQYNKTQNLAELVAKDIFCCFDRNLDDGDHFKRTNRLYCIIKEGGEHDFIMYTEPKSKGLFGKRNGEYTPVAKYFSDLKNQYDADFLPKTKEG
ncbi:hypothetical protein [Ruminococcus sp. NK3A76]|uniref:hypothetical protein n=1 Tax=Ruminococcus sp. NK3A76 TaxID=877411 RepID=UPI00048ACDF5|nr:hypothetical protein [Ruminococcus sp. NK3A76]